MTWVAQMRMALGACGALFLLGLHPPGRAQEVRPEPASEAAYALRTAAKAMARHDAQAALTALRRVPPADADARYLRVRALLALGRYPEALAALDGDWTPPAPVRAEVQALRSELRFRLGDCQEEVDQPWQRVMRAQCLLAAEHPAQAADLFDQAMAKGGRLDRFERPVVALWAAEASLAAGQQEAAGKRLRQLHIRYPAHRIATRVNTLWSEVDGKPLDYQEGVERARAAYAARDYALAAQLYKQLHVPKGRSEAVRHLHAHGMAVFRSREDYSEAAKLLGRAARLAGAGGDRDAFYAARALARADRDREAVTAFDRLVRTRKRGRWVAQAAYLSAWLRLRHNFPKARARMLQFVNGRHAALARSQAEEARFGLAMDDLDAGRYRAAQQGFERYANGGHGAMERGRGLYWAGRAAQLGGQHKQAKAHYLEARKVEPLHYYAQLAEQRLRDLGDAPAPLLEPPSIESGTPAALPEKAAFFARLGLLADAGRALRSAEPRALAHPSSLGQVLPYAVAHRKLHNHERAAALVRPFMRKLMDASARGEVGLALRLSYGRPRLDTARAYAEESGVDLDLLYAIMRKESDFDAAAHSYADAIGLMQLLPSTAERVAERAGAESGVPFDRGMLWNPDDNIRLGAQYLGGLLARYPQHPALAIAAYNAGTHHVDGWLQRITQQGDPAMLDRLVEDIPIVQTRNYVRRVLTNWARYRYLGGEGQAPFFTLAL